MKKTQGQIFMVNSIQVLISLLVVYPLILGAKYLLPGYCIWVGWAWIYMAFFALAMIVASYRMHKVEKLRIVALSPVSEWPPMTFRRFKWVIWLAHRANMPICHEDVCDLYKRSQSDIADTLTMDVRWAKIAGGLPLRHQLKDTWISDEDRLATKEVVLFDSLIIPAN